MKWFSHVRPSIETEPRRAVSVVSPTFGPIPGRAAIAIDASDVTGVTGVEGRVVYQPRAWRCILDRVNFVYAA